MLQRSPSPSVHGMQTRSKRKREEEEDISKNERNTKRLDLSFSDESSFDSESEKEKEKSVVVEQPKAKKQKLLHRAKASQQKAQSDEKEKAVTASRVVINTIQQSQLQSPSSYDVVKNINSPTDWKCYWNEILDNLKSLENLTYLQLAKIHRIELHPYLTKKTHMPHRKLFRSNLLGEIGFVTRSESNSLPHITYQLCAQKETITSQVVERTEEILFNSGASMFVSMETTPSTSLLREYILNKNQRRKIIKEMNGTVTNENSGLLISLENRLSKRIFEKNKKPYLYIFHFTYSPESILVPSKTIEESDIFVAYYYSKSAAGLNYKANPKAVAFNYSARLTMFLDQSLIARKKSIRIGELQYIQRNVEEKTWFINEKLNDSTSLLAHAFCIKDIKKCINPYYLTYARDSVSLQLLPGDTPLITDDGDKIIQREWLIPHDNFPSDYDSSKHSIPFKNESFKSVGVPVGVTQYLNLFPENVQSELDSMTDELDYNFEIDALQEALETCVPDKIKFEIVLRVVDSVSKIVIEPKTKLRSTTRRGRRRKQPVIQCVIHFAARNPLLQIYQGLVSLQECIDSSAIAIDVQSYNCGSKKEANALVVEFMNSAVGRNLETAKLSCHRTLQRSGKLLRTKLFFEFTYLWTKAQLEEVGACFAHFTRRSSAPIPEWIKEKLVSKLVSARIIGEGFINSSAINIYHTGTEGLYPHFDDNVRFNPPIVSYQPFSDKRLCFGAVDNAMTNPLFCVPLQKGTLSILEKNSYASIAQRHGVRTQDMSEKSGVILLRNIPERILSEANKFEPTRAKLSCDHKTHYLSGRPVKIVKPNRGNGKSVKKRASKD